MVEPAAEDMLQQVAGVGKRRAEDVGVLVGHTAQIHEQVFALRGPNRPNRLTDDSSPPPTA